jgi:hypothetical protein
MLTFNLYCCDFWSIKRFKTLWNLSRFNNNLFKVKCLLRIFQCVMMAYN